MTLRTDNLAEARYFKEWIRLRRLIGLDESYNDFMPNARVRALANSGVAPTIIEDFLRLGAKINFLRSVAGSLRCVSSGIRSYISFCVLIGRPFLPPSEDTVLLWGSTFKPGRTYRNYLSHLRKACLLTGSDFQWDTQAVHAVAKGLRSAQRISFKFPNFLFILRTFSRLSVPQGGDPSSHNCVLHPTFSPSGFHLRRY